MANHAILPLKQAKKHLNRDSFDCGSKPLNHYICEQASQDERKGLSRTFVLFDQDKPKELLGYYTLSASSVQFEDYPEPLRKRFPKYPIPVALIGRLAVSASHKGRGLGGELLADAFKKVLVNADTLGIHGVIVDAKDDSAVAFYKTFGLQEFPSNPLKLVIPLQTIRNSL